MGSCSFINRAEASSVYEAFNCLVEGAVREYGDNPYNGTISTCSLGRTVKTFEKYSKTNEDKAYKLIEKDNYGEKRYAKAIDLGTIYYEVTTFKKKLRKKKNQNGQWHTLFVMGNG